jgi:hypothetical protein
MMEIYAAARQFMVENGNPHQWAERNWPPEELIRRDIAQGKSHVCVHEGKIVGAFYYDYGKDIDPTYDLIEDGNWMDDSAYGVVHRLGSDRSVKGIGAFCINWAFEQCGHLRVDTHGDNKPMQNLAKSLGFTHCGTIYVKEDPYPRLAYEKLKK